MGFSLKTNEAIADVERLMEVISRMDEIAKQFNQACERLSASLQDKVADLATQMSNTILVAVNKVKEYTYDVSGRVKDNLNSRRDIEKKAERD